MTIKTLWGQYSESYEGEHAPELLLAIDEFVLEANEEIWDKEKARVLSGGYENNFISIKEINIEVDGDVIRNILLSTPSIKAKVNPQRGSYTEKQL